MKINYPKVHVDKNQLIFISFYIANKRYRLYNGKRINSKTNPNDYPNGKRVSIGKMLASEVYEYIVSGGVLREYKKMSIACGKLSDVEYLNDALTNKLNSNYSHKYKSSLKSVFRNYTKSFKGKKITTLSIETFLNKYQETSYNTNRRHLTVLFNEAIKQGMSQNPMEGIKARKAKATLHKPFSDVPLILEEIKRFNHKLHLCCLITFGCLLRPHREVRELSWRDFSEDLSYINLSGHRNKSGKNRIVPVPKYVRDVLIQGDSEINIFSGKVTPLNNDYFKTLWSRFKKVSTLLEDGQTLYSFRHTGAVDIFKRTGSITKLQKAMGHSSINVSLTYLRGLEVGELKEEDMPVL
jgi:integrase